MCQPKVVKSPLTKVKMSPSRKGQKVEQLLNMCLDKLDNQAPKNWAGWKGCNVWKRNG